MYNEVTKKYVEQVMKAWELDETNGPLSLENVQSAMYEVMAYGIICGSKDTSLGKEALTIVQELKEIHSRWNKTSKPLTCKHS